MKLFESGEEIMPWTVKPLREIAQKKSLEYLATDALETQVRAIWLAWKIIYLSDLSQTDKLKRAAAAQKIAALSMNSALLKELSKKGKVEERQIPVTVEFNKKKK